MLGDEGRKVGGREWPADEVALHEVATPVPQERELVFLFDPLGEHSQVEAAAHRDNGRNDRGVVGSRSEGADDGCPSEAALHARYGTTRRPGTYRGPMAMNAPRAAPERIVPAGVPQTAAFAAAR